jgi:hypothetical protein
MTMATEVASELSCDNTKKRTNHSELTECLVSAYRTHFFISSAVKPSPHRERPNSVTGIIDEPLVLGIRRLLWMHSRMRVMVLGEANNAFGNNAA